MSKRAAWLNLSPIARRARAFARDEQGVTMVEFSILALPFFTIIGAQSTGAKTEM